MKQATFDPIIRLLDMNIPTLSAQNIAVKEMFDQYVIYQFQQLGTCASLYEANHLLNLLGAIYCTFWVY